MTLFGTRKGPQQWLTAVVIAGLAMTLTPMQGRCDSISMYEMLMKYVKPTKKPVKKVTCCPNAQCCLSGQCNSGGACCPAGGCCTLPQAATCPFGVCTGAATMPCCPILGCPTTCCQEVCRIGNVCIIIVSNAGQVGAINEHAARENFFINQFRPSSFWSGITPAGTFTPDLGCPICPTCVQPPKPQGGVFCVPVDPATQQALQRKLTLSFNNVPLSHCIEDIKAYLGNFNIFIDEHAVHGAGTRLNKPCTMNCDQMSLESVLNQLLKSSGLDFLVENKAIKVTSEQAVRQAQFTKALPTGGIWIGQTPTATIYGTDMGVPFCATCVQPPKPQGGQAAHGVQVQRIQPVVFPNPVAEFKGALPRIPRDGNSVSVKVVIKNHASDKRVTRTYPVADLVISNQGIKSPMVEQHQAATQKAVEVVHTGIGSYLLNSLGGSPSVCPSNSCCEGLACQSFKLEDKLIKLIVSCIDPRSWSDQGGQGTIQYFPLGNVLVVGHQTAEVQEQIVCLLNALRFWQECGLNSKPTACSACESCSKTPSVDLFNCLIEKMIVPFLNPDQACCTPQCQPVRVIKPDQCGMCPQCLPERVNKLDCVVPVVSFRDSVNCVDMKKCADELQRLCVEHERTIRELQEITNDLRQEVSNLRHDIHMSRHAQPTYAPPYNMQPVSFPQPQMPETYFFVPAMQHGHPMTLPTTGYVPRIPR